MKDLENHVSNPAQEQPAIRSSLASHTPGPWTFDRDGRDGDWANVHGPRWGAFARVVIRFEEDQEDDPIGMANARLIAAAPELLASLKAMCSNMANDGGEYRDCYKRALSVIAKAEGKQ